MMTTDDTKPQDKKTDIHPAFIAQAQSLCAGGELLPGNLNMLAARLQQAAHNQTPLRVKLGLDPTRPDLHLGHSVVLRKLKLFQDLGHTAVLLVGNATALIGDPSGRNNTRPPLTPEEVAINAQTYLDQASKIIDITRAEVVHNHDWFKDMAMQDLLKLTAKVTVAQLLVRDDFAKRYAQEQPIFLHELLYPLMQGYDSVAINADIELGGTDQRFNNLMGRELQQAYQCKGQPQLVLLMPLLEGTDGVVKMSKSYPAHCVNLTDAPNDMFGKLMSIPDTMLGRYQQLLLNTPAEQIAEQQHRFVLPLDQGGMNPRDVKAGLARALVDMYHGAGSGDAAEAAFIQQFKQGGIPDDAPQVQVATVGPHGVMDLMVAHQLAPSKAEARRLIAGGGVRVNGEKIQNDTATLTLLAGEETVMQVGKRKFLRLTVGA
jgi:tyrosyl-tRNA synthetase